MTGRIVGALVVLLLLGTGAGYAVAAATEGPDAPDSFPTPASVPAQSPSFPVTVYDVEPDPGVAPLATDVPLRVQGFRSGEFRLRAPVPVGWLRVELSGGSAWQFSVSSHPAHTYLLRLGIVAGDRRTPGVQTNARIFALRQQELDGNSENFIVEEQADTGFTYTLIDDDGFQRVGMERFLAVPGSSSAYYTVAISGRETDREGMAAMLDRVLDGAVVP